MSYGVCLCLSDFTHMTISRFIHVAESGIISFFYGWANSIVCMYHIFFIYSSVNGRVGCFYVLAIVNSAAMNTGVHVSSWIKALSGYMLWLEHISEDYRITGSYGTFIFSFLRKRHTIFYGGSTICVLTSSVGAFSFSTLSLALDGCSF